MRHNVPARKVRWRRKRSPNSAEYHAPKQMSYSYRGLMDIKQLGLYIYENGFKILRHGASKAHNGVIAQAR